MQKQLILELKIVNLDKYFKNISYQILIKITIFMLVFTGITNNIKSQTALSLKFSPISLHPFKEQNKVFFENKIDSNASFVVTPCVILSSETFIYSDELNVRFMLGGMSDAVSHAAMFFQAGLKYRFLQVYKSGFSIGAGVVFYGRECRLEENGFFPEKFWHKNGSWEYSIGGLGEFEYNLMLGDKHDLLFSLVYGFEPKSFTATVGYRFWLSTTIKHRKKCGSCPFGNSSKGKKWNQ